MSSPDTTRRSRISIGPTLLRRGWIVLVSMALVGLLAYGIANLQAATYTAQSTLTVSPSIGPANPGDAQQASSLADAYKRAIPNDEQLRRLLRGQVGSRGTITATGGRSSVIRITYADTTRARALKGAKLLADALSSDRQRTSSVTPGTLQVVRHAASAPLSGGRYRAEMVLIVPSGAAPAAGISADQANKLATTYAGLIPADDGVVAAVAKNLKVSEDEVRSSLTLVNLKDTSLVQVTYKADSAKRAAEGATTVARIVSGPRPGASGIIPSSMDIVSLPKASAAPTKNTKTAIPIGVIIGLILGLILLVAWERSDPHVRDARDLSAQIGCPATPIDRLSRDAASALIERWATLTDRVPAHVAVLPANPQAEEGTEAAIAQLVDSSGGGVRYEDARSGALPEDRSFADVTDSTSDLVLVHAGPPGGDGSGESVALGCDLTVVVVPKGMKAADVRTLAEDLADFGIVPVWSLLSPRRISSARSKPRARAHATAG
jgi:capsular polysaccharide biosynthesis protein